jgi:3-oxoacyl-[acyl-carrier protein] reductase
MPTVLITGGSGGLARELVHHFTAEGYAVLAPSHAELDVTDETSVPRFFESLPALDVCVHAAGVTRDALLVQQSPEDWQTVVDVNLRGAFLVSQAALKKMVPAKSGHVLFIGSRAAQHGTAGQSAYAAAKAGLIGLSRSIAMEYGKRQIRSNVVCPGFLETPMTATLSTEQKAAAKAAHTLGEFNSVEESARFIVFLAQQPFISGQVFQLDSRIDAWT